MYMEPTYIISEVVKSSMSARMSAPQQPKYGGGSTTANIERLKRRGTTPGPGRRELPRAPSSAPSLKIPLLTRQAKTPVMTRSFARVAARHGCIAGVLV